MLKDFLPKIRPEVDRKLPEKQVKNLQKTSLKLFPSTPTLQINSQDEFNAQELANTAWAFLAGLFAISGYSGRASGRFFGGF